MFCLRKQFQLFSPIQNGKITYLVKLRELYLFILNYCFQTSQVDVENIENNSNILNDHSIDNGNNTATAITQLDSEQIEKSAPNRMKKFEDPEK